MISGGLVLELNNSLILQWGNTKTTQPTETRRILFPISFEQILFATHIMASKQSAYTYCQYYGAYDWTNLSINIVISSSSNNHVWFAIGK